VLDCLSQECVKLVKEVWEADGEHRNKWNTLGALKYELMRI